MTVDSVKSSFGDEMDNFKESNFLSYLYLAFQLPSFDSCEINLDAVHKINEDYYCLLVTYDTKENSKKKRFWAELRGALLSDIEEIYHRFPKLDKQEDVGSESDEFLDKYIDRIIVCVGNLSYTNGVSHFNYVKSVVDPLIDSYCEKLVETENFDAIKHVKDILNNAYTHNFSNYRN